jgi:purine nucleoside phosphorylase
VLVWQQDQVEMVYLARHGAAADIPPHRVNYRANIWALRQRGVDAIIGLNAVGGISSAAWPGRLVVPHQLIDYTWGREQTFFDGTVEALRHIEFDPPFTEEVRAQLAAAARHAGIDLLDHATYGVTQGPRLETAAEIDRLAADGCDIVGMTAMPEAALAREVEAPYAICAVVVNRAAGRLPPGGSIHGQLAANLAQGADQLRRLLDAFCRSC